MSAASTGIVWIASYPKSGNTWMRFFACNLLFGRQESAESLGTLIPDLHEMGKLTVLPTAQGIVKTHFPFSTSLPSAGATAGAIYVVRDPADVLTSNFFYSQRSTDRPDESSTAFDAYVEQFIRAGGDERWLERGIGSWEENVRSWTGRLPFPVVTVRYEDMVSDPLGTGRRIADLLAPGCPSAAIAEAVRNSSFQRLRDIERADIRAKRVGIFYKPYLQSAIDGGHRFMRRGLPGDGRTRLSAEQRQRLDARFGAVLRELGYPE
jgi:aryl sulfotransferase